MATETRRSFHDLRPDAFQYSWDNSIEPALEIESGEGVLLHVRDASDEQIHAGSSAEDVLALDFTHVNPVSGPIFVKGAQPGDTLAVEIVGMRPQAWGWTAIIPGFTIVFPGLTRRIGKGLSEAEGIVGTGEA